MTAVDYERAALDVLGLPHPDAPEAIGFHEIGVTELSENPDACRAVVTRRLSRIRKLATDLPTGRERATAAQHDFLAYGEYVAALGRIHFIRERVKQLENIERRKEFDQEYRDNTYFYAEKNTPSLLEAQLARNFDPDRHTADWAGYMAYIAQAAPTLHSFFYRRLPVLIPEDARKRHTYITGQSGSGKSELLKVLLNAYLQSNARVGLVLIDPHGDLAEQVARWSDLATSDRLIFLNPALAPDRTPTINPFELADQSEASVHVMAEQIASVFDELMRKAGHASLTGNMGALLVPCISTLLRRPGSSIRDLQTFMDDKRNRELVEAGCRSPVPSHRDFFRHQFFAKQYDSTKGALFTRIQSLLNSPVLYRLLVGPSTVNLEEAVNDGKAVVFALPKGGIGAETSPTFGSFVLAMLQGIAIRREGVPEADRMPVHVFVDECQNFLSPSVQTILTESRKYGLHLTLAQQTFAQDMDMALAAAVVGNTAVKFCGMNDVKTLKAMNERMAVGMEALQQLSVGRFFVKVSGNTPAFKLIVPIIRGDIGADAWRATKEHQLGAYYRPIGDEAPEAHESPAELELPLDRMRPAPTAQTRATGSEVQPDAVPARRRPRKPSKVDLV